MVPVDSHERNQFQQLLGARDERISQLERQLFKRQGEWETDAREWQRLQRYRDELAEWLVDGATDESGRLVKLQIDAGLRGESYVPCTFTTSICGRRFRIALVATNYEVIEIPVNG